MEPSTLSIRVDNEDKKGFEIKSAWVPLTLDNGGNSLKYWRELGH